MLKEVWRQRQCGEDTALESQLSMRLSTAQTGNSSPHTVNSVISDFTELNDRSNLKIHLGEDERAYLSAQYMFT